MGKRVFEKSMVQLGIKMHIVGSRCLRDPLKDLTKTVDRYFV